MLLYILFWMFMGFIIHFYIIFGTNLLTRGPAHIAVFLPISVFRRKEYKMESKQNETFGSVIFGTEAIQRTWSTSQGSFEEVTRVEGAPPYLVGPLTLHQRTPSSYIYLRIPERSERSQKPNSTAAIFYIHEIPS